MQRALAFDQSPPLGVALRFFLNVPVFLLFAALVLAWTSTGDAPYGRWHPGVLAAAHLLTLGVLASAMLGAMMQILPVAARIRVLHANVTSPIVHMCLTLGVLALAGGFLTGNGTLHGAAVVLLGLAFLIFLVAVIAGLIRDWKRRSPGSSEVLVAVRLAAAALLITITLGIYMAGLKAGFWAPSSGAGNWLPRLPDLHVVWGLAGWVGLLVVGVSYQVIPIFQATEIYPRRLTDHLAPVAFAALILFSITLLWTAPPGTNAVAWLAGGVLALCYLAYGLTTHWLLRTRKRPAPEPTTWFWHVGMAALMVAAILAVPGGWLAQRGGSSGAGASAQMLLGTSLVLGFGVSAVNGMLYKIIPFLLWHNAQRRAPVALPYMPKVKQFIAERDAMRQFYAHAVAVILLSVASLIPALLLPGAIALAVSAGLLAWNMGLALRLYMRTCRRIAATLPGDAPPTTAQRH